MGIINARSAINPIIATVAIAVSPFLNALEAIKPKQNGITKSMMIVMLSPLSSPPDYNNHRYYVLPSVATLRTLAE